MNLMFLAWAHAAEPVLTRVYGGDYEYLRGPALLADVDNDATSDLVVANWSGASEYFTAGEVFCFGGLPSGVVAAHDAPRVVYGTDEHNYVGTALALFGAAERPFLAIGAERSGLDGRDPGGIYLFADPLGESGRTSADDAQFLIQGTETRDRLGAHLVAADLDGDGETDLAAAAPANTDGVGTVWLIAGSAELARTPASISDVAVSRIDGDTSTFAGWRLTSGGDLDGDGLEDLLIGSFDPALPWGGRIHRFGSGVLTGSLTLGDALDTWTVADPDCWLGQGLAAGDSDEDGADEAWASAPFGCGSVLGEGLIWQLPAGGGELAVADALADGEWNEAWGASLAISPGRLVIGAPGAARVDIVSAGVTTPITGLGELGAWVGSWRDTAGERVGFTAPASSLNGTVNGSFWMVDPDRIPEGGLVVDEVAPVEDTGLPAVAPTGCGMPTPVGVWIAGLIAVGRRRMVRAEAPLPRAWDAMHMTLDSTLNRSKP